MSYDGDTWLKGAGEYSGEWGATGEGIVVRYRGTFYVRFYSPNSGAELRVAAHGTPWGNWRTIGPRAASPFGTSAAAPVVLKFTEVGTPQSRITWVDGPGYWTGLAHEGAYDFALHEHARWTLPPVIILRPPPPGFWANVRNVFRTEPALPAVSAPEDPVIEIAVTDSGTTGSLLATTMLAAMAVWALLIFRSRRRRRDSSESR